MNRDTPAQSTQVRSTRRLTKEQFVAEAEKVYGPGRHDYSEFTYINNSTKSIIRCLIHDFRFEQDATNHRKGYNACPQCPGKKGASRKMHVPTMIARAKEIHGADAYDYGEVGEPKNTKEKFWLGCNSCLEDFEVNFDGHVYHKTGCKCLARAAQSQSNYVKKSITERNLMSEYPDIAAEWSSTNKVGAHEVAPKSHMVMGWNCPMGHHYEMKISNRTAGKQGCPMCANRRVHDENNFGNNLEGVAWWDHEENDGKVPSEFTKSSGETAWFRCDCIDECTGEPIRHLFKMRLNNFANGERCPYGAGRRCAPDNCVGVHIPEIVQYWDVAANDGVTAHEVVYGSGKKYKMRCPVASCGATWAVSPNGARAGIRCPGCNTIGFSPISIRWLQTLPEYGSIQHATEGGEYHIPGTYYHADGYCAETNTIYEFHGTYWHGDPRITDPDAINAVVQKTFGELYARTLKREELIRSMGYNLVTMWEHDFRAIEAKK